MPILRFPQHGWIYACTKPKYIMRIKYLLNFALMLDHSPGLDGQASKKH